MSKGSRVVPVRLPHDLLSEVMRDIEVVNERRVGEPFNLSTWIRAAITEKLAHRRRSRSKARVYYTGGSKGEQQCESDNPSGEAGKSSDGKTTCVADSC